MVLIINSSNVALSRFLQWHITGLDFHYIPYAAKWKIADLIVIQWKPSFLDSHPLSENQDDCAIYYLIWYCSSSFTDLGPLVEESRAFLTHLTPFLYGDKTNRKLNILLHQVPTSFTNFFTIKVIPAPPRIQSTRSNTLTCPHFQNRKWSVCISNCAHIELIMFVISCSSTGICIWIWHQFKVSISANHKSWICRVSTIFETILIYVYIWNNFNMSIFN